MVGPDLEVRDLVVGERVGLDVGDGVVALPPGGDVDRPALDGRRSEIALVGERAEASEGELLQIRGAAHEPDPEDRRAGPWGIVLPYGWHGGGGGDPPFATLARDVDLGVWPSIELGEGPGDGHGNIMHKLQF